MTPQQQQQLQRLSSYYKFLTRGKYRTLMSTNQALISFFFFYPPQPHFHWLQFCLRPQSGDKTQKRRQYKYTATEALEDHGFTVHVLFSWSRVVTIWRMLFSRSKRLSFPVITTWSFLEIIANSTRYWAVACHSAQQRRKREGKYRSARYVAVRSK